MRVEGALLATLVGLVAAGAVQLFTKKWSWSFAGRATAADAFTIAPGVTDKVTPEMEMPITPLEKLLPGKDVFKQPEPDREVVMADGTVHIISGLTGTDLGPVNPYEGQEFEFYVPPAETSVHRFSVGDWVREYEPDGTPVRAPSFQVIALTSSAYKLTGAGGYPQYQPFSLLDNLRPWGAYGNYWGPA